MGIERTRIPAALGPDQRRPGTAAMGSPAAGSRPVAVTLRRIARLRSSFLLTPSRGGPYIFICLIYIFTPSSFSCFFFFVFSLLFPFARPAEKFNPIYLLLNVAYTWLYYCYLPKTRMKQTDKNLCSSGRALNIVV